MTSILSQFHLNLFHLSPIMTIQQKKKSKTKKRKKRRQRIRPMKKTILMIKLRITIMQLFRQDTNYLIQFILPMSTE